MNEYPPNRIFAPQSTIFDVIATDFLDAIR